jgi:RNA polymerase sigma-70 factor (ECF subfamily)
VVEHGIARLIELREAMIRDYRCCIGSLNDHVVIGEGEHIERGDLLNHDTYMESVGNPAMSIAERVALRVDLERLLATLPPELRNLWARVEEGQNFTDISRETGIPRGTLYDRMKQLRKLAEDAGLRAYLEPDNPADTSATAPVSNSCKSGRRAKSDGRSK